MEGTTMKDNPGTPDAISLISISGTLLNIPRGERKPQRTLSELLNTFIRFTRNSTFRQVLPVARHLYSSYKEQIQICFATIAIGAILLGSIFVFFTQLAEYGWWKCVLFKAINKKTGCALYWTETATGCSLKKKWKITCTPQEGISTLWVFPTT